MSTAVIITGHMRSFATCAHTLKWQVLRHFPAPAFYVSTVADGDAASADLLRTLFPGAPVHIETVPAQPDLPEPAEPVRFEPYARSVPLQAVLRQLWQLERGWSLFCDRAEGNPDVVIRVRPDLYFHSFKPESAANVKTTDALLPWWGRFGGCNDRFAVLGREAARCYFTALSYMADSTAAGCPLHPESLIRAAMEMRGCTVYDMLLTDFSCLRSDGQARPPEVSASDIVAATIGGARL